MKVFANFISSLVLAFWLSAISIFSIQNIEPVSIKFFVWQSIQIRVGVLLTICAGVGIIVGSLLPLLLTRKTKTY